MLKRVFSPEEISGFQLPVSQAAFPSPFTHSLEFNPPAHGVWNIVHVGMLVPQSHQIYVCGANCMRGVVLTAAEMDLSDRFSMVLLEERDLMDGRIENITIEGVCDVLQKLPVLPPIVMVFTVCTHRFLACDLDYIYRELQKRFPSVRFLRCFMEPITMKEGLSPDQRLRKTMYDPLEPLPVQRKTAAVLGSDFRLDESSDLRRMLESDGWNLMEIQDCGTLEEFLALGSASVYLSTFPRARYGAEETARRIGRQHHWLPASFSFDEIREHERSFSKALGLSLPDFDAEEDACKTALRDALAVTGSTPIVIDYTVHPRPLGLARLLLIHGFTVKKVYLNAIEPSEESDFYWLQKNAPDLLLCSLLRPQRRVVPRGEDGMVLAIGQAAAWCEDTAHFVNLVEGAGLWGYDGIRRMAALMTEAYLTEKDTKDLIPRKGWGCDSCI